MEPFIYKLLASLIVMAVGATYIILNDKAGGKQVRNTH